MRIEPERTGIYASSFLIGSNWEQLIGKNFRETLNEQLKDPEFKNEWDALEPEFQIMKAIIGDRTEQDLTQKRKRITYP